MRILIADDNLSMRKALRQALEEHEGGWTVCGETEDGQAAIDQAEQCKPDLVLLDLAMPRVNGLVAAARISELLPGIPILMLTLYDSSHLRAEAKKVGIL